MSGPDLVREVQRWILFAREDLQTAQRLVEGGASAPRHACWLAQQAAEKALKAGLVMEQVPFPFRHDLDALRNLLPEGWETKRTCPDLAELTEWAVEARYPGDWPDATIGDARQAVEQALLAYESIVRDLVHRGFEIDLEPGR
jgi:HEPN domain-containing protein